LILRLRPEVGEAEEADDEEKEGEGTEQEQDRLCLRMQELCALPVS
jgi:hypothetical protein